MTATAAAGRIDPAPPALRRLARLATLTPADRAVLASAIAGPVRTTARFHELVIEGWPAQAPLLLLDGWAARVRVLSDGRRQILGLLLPGDLIGWPTGGRPVVAATVIALTTVTTCVAPDPCPDTDNGPDADSYLAQAYATVRTLDETYLFNQIVRLGRLTAHERIGSLLLELHERLAAIGAVRDDRFRLPMTQETIADLTGLTSVHVNRTIQAMRRDGSIALTGGFVRLIDPAALAQACDYRPCPPAGANTPATADAPAIADAHDDRPFG